MPVRLFGGYELDSFWKDVREQGNDRMRKEGFSDWTVTLRQKTISDVEQAESLGETDTRLYHNVDKKEIELAGDIGNKGGVSVKKFIELHIMDFLYQLTDQEGVTVESCV